MMEINQEHWHKIQTALSRHRLPQGMLFVGPLHCQLAEFTRNIIQLAFCKTSQVDPCGTCSHCQMVHRMEHPDVEWIKPEKSGGAIKIDQIRALQHSAYLTTQRAAYRFIIIEGADRLNTAAGNALLKILEEPAKHTVFILIAKQLSSVLPTVLSRCQISVFSTKDDTLTGDMLSLVNYYSEDAFRSELLKQSEAILDELIAVIVQKEHPCSVAARWAQFDLEVLLWFLYLVFSQLQYIHCMKVSMPSFAHSQISQLLTLLDPVLIFTLLDKMNPLLMKINLNRNVNQTLALEDLLFSLIT